MIRLIVDLYSLFKNILKKKFSIRVVWIINQILPELKKNSALLLEHLLRRGLKNNRLVFKQLKHLITLF